MAGFLHDVLEDTDIPAEVIKDLFGESILQAVTALTRRDDEDYFAFIRRAKENSIAAKVKMADLRHNSDLSRIAQVTAITDTSLVSLVRCGFGTAVLPELTLSCCDCSGLYVYPLVPMGFRTLGIVSRDPRFLTPAGRDLIECIREVGGQKQ